MNKHVTAESTQKTTDLVSTNDKGDPASQVGAKELLNGSKRTEAVDKRLLLGIDLGTSQTAVMSSNGDKAVFRSVVGYPKDLIGVKLLGAPYIVGDQALDLKTCLDIRFPLEEGVLREYTERDLEIARHLLSHAIAIAPPKSGQKVCAIIGVPARASAFKKNLILQIAEEITDTALLVSEPFMVAYGKGMLDNALIIDIGAGTIDICALKGTIPAPEDQITIGKSGNYVDEKLRSLILEKHPGIQINNFVACSIKEKHSFVGDIGGPINVDSRAGGKPVTYDIATQIKSACESLIPEIIESIETLIQGFPPENQSAVLKNILVAGGGSQIRGIDTYIAEQLSDFGDVEVTTIDDPTFGGCAGSLKLAQDLPPKYWDQLGTLISH